MDRRHFILSSGAWVLAPCVSAMLPQAQACIEALWRLDPDAAVQAGRFEFAHRLTIPDAAQRQRQAAYQLRWLRELDRVPTQALGQDERTDLDVLRAKLLSDQWHLTVFQSHQWNPAQHNVARVIELILQTDYAPLPKRLAALGQRLAKVPAYYLAAQASLHRPTREHTELALEQAPGVLSVLDDVAQASGRPFKAVVGQAKRAVQGYAAHLKQRLDSMQRDPSQARSFRIGPSLYEAKFGHDIQSDRSAQQTYELAQLRRDELLTRMDAQAQSLWPRVMKEAPQPADRFARIQAVIDALSSRHVPRDQFVQAIRQQIPELEAWVRQHDLVTLDPDKPLEVRETPAYQRGVAGAGIEAPGPYRPNERTYYHVTPLDGLSEAQAQSSLREYNHWILQILNIHEAIPGHYTQLVYANRSPSLVKSLFGNDAMVEGWAVYAERMMIDSGYQASPEMQLMYGKWHLRSVTNTLLDYQVHVLGIGQAEALDLLQRQAFQTEREAHEKWRRVQLTAVQLTSYFSGYNDIMALREQLMARPGFSLKAFHERFLSFGSIPVREIAKLML
jgi:uncharacterized protein (DUF885 family)